MTYYIYCITNKTNNKSYVGQSIDVKNRWYKHILDAKRVSGKTAITKKFAIQNAINKCGEDNFTWQIIDQVETIDEANESEEFFIAYLQTLSPNGYNLLPGGNNHHLTEMVKQKISDTLKITSFFIGKQGADHPNYGRKISQHNRDNLSLIFSGDGANNKKINGQIARSIYLDYLNDDTSNAIRLSQKYGLKQVAILNILNKKSWKEATKDLVDIPKRQGKRR
jgi:group I intron endonuclease